MIDVGGIQETHEQPIQPQRDAGTGRQAMVEGGEQLVNTALPLTPGGAGSPGLRRRPLTSLASAASLSRNG